MLPVIQPGMQLRLRLIPVSQLRVGDIISIPDWNVDLMDERQFSFSTHRVVWIARGKIYTKGDNNRHVDARVISEDRFIYKLEIISNGDTHFSFTSLRGKFLNTIFLLYGFLQIVGVPERFLRGRRFLTRLCTGFW